MNSEQQDNRDLCAEPHPDDGVPPQVLARRKRNVGSVKAGRHRLGQLCKQVRVALEQAIACDCGDPEIQCLELVSVKPVTGSSVLEVTLRSPVADLAAIERAHARLESASGLLRAVVGDAINRKRVPQLRFRVIA